jgi:hypothetical protein
VIEQMQTSAYTLIDARPVSGTCCCTRVSTRSIGRPTKRFRGTIVPSKRMRSMLGICSPRASPQTICSPAAGAAERYAAHLADGMRFVAGAADESTRAPISVVLNWEQIVN